ncbi:hypothetical protein, partial [Bacillus thuringiensis]|uniref:hypothetical protein n=1 Tax=Bacillus thuringiensis TaxID=1428 RepID=UPI001C9316E5
IAFKGSFLDRLLYFHIVLPIDGRKGYRLGLNVYIFGEFGCLGDDENVEVGFEKVGIMYVFEVKYIKEGLEVVRKR